jgi:hypothetical protein
MNKIDDFVLNLPDAVRRQIISDYDEFKGEGFIGCCVLRDKTRELMDILGLGRTSITTWMDELAKKCIRFYADLYLKDSK